MVILRIKLIFILFILFYPVLFKQVQRKVIKWSTKSAVSGRTQNTIQECYLESNIKYIALLFGNEAHGLPAKPYWSR